MRDFAERGPESGAGRPTPEVGLWYDHSDGWPVDDASDARRGEAAADLGRVALRGALLPDERAVGAPAGLDSRDAGPAAGELGRFAVGAEVTIPAEGADRTGHVADVPDLDTERLRREPSAREHFSDPEIAWVPLDQIETTEQVRGEPFKDGTDRAAYAAEVTESLERHDAGAPVGIDPRLTGDHRIRLCEDPDSGVLTVTNGRHRIQAAREAGLRAVVAEVVVARRPEARPGALPGWAEGRAGDVTFGTTATENSHRTFWTRDGQAGDRHQTTEIRDGVLHVRTHEDGVVEGWTEDLATGEVTRFRRRER